MLDPPQLRPWERFVAEKKALIARYALIGKWSFRVGMALLLVGCPLSFVLLPSWTVWAFLSLSVASRAVWEWSWEREMVYMEALITAAEIVARGADAVREYLER